MLSSRSTRTPGPIQFKRTMPSPSDTNPIMSLGEHLDDLRRRVMYAIYGLLPIFMAALYFGKPMLAVVTSPVEKALHAAGQGGRQIATAPLETLNTYLKLSFVLTMLVGSPWVLYQLWRFVAPGLYQRERRFVYFLLPLSALLSIAGVAFFYFATLPVLLHFLIAFGADLGTTPPATAPLPDGITLPIIPVLPADPTGAAPNSMWINSTLNEMRVQTGPDRVMGLSLHNATGIISEFRVSESVRMILMFSLAFAAAFQMPVLVLLLGWAKIVDVAFLSKYRRHAALVLSIIAALLTPADPFSMLFMLGALYALYELGIVLLRFFPASRIAGKPAAGTQDAAEDPPRPSGPAPEAAPAPIGPPTPPTGTPVDGTVRGPGGADPYANDRRAVPNSTAFRDPSDPIGS